MLDSIPERGGLLEFKTISRRQHVGFQRRDLLLEIKIDLLSIASKDAMAVLLALSSWSRPRLMAFWMVSGVSP